LNLPEARVTERSDANLKAYNQLRTSLRELLVKDEPQRIGWYRQRLTDRVVESTNSVTQ
jgi:hypothetical protein